MGNQFNAQLFGRRRRGDREDVRIRLFNPDGSPAELGGGGSQGGYALSGWINGIEVPNDGEPISLPLGNTIIDGAEGFDLVEGFSVQFEDTSVSAPKGMYSGQLTLRAQYESSPPTSGFVYMGLATLSDNFSGGIVTIQATAMNPAESPFDYTLVGSPDMTKLGLGTLPEDGRIELQVVNNTDMHLWFGGRVLLAKI